MKKYILFTIIGLIAGTTLTVGAAYVYTARDINYQPSDENWNVENVQEALTELKTDVNSISNKVEGIERVYKEGEVELVALVSDDSFYTDSNGKYVLSNSDTGRTLLADTSTYKSLASTEECIGEVGADTAIPLSKKTRTVTKQISVPPYSGSDLTYKETVFTELTEIVGITKITGDGQHPSNHQSEFFSAETYDNIVKITVYRKQSSPTTPMVFNVTVAGY